MKTPRLDRRELLLSTLSLVGAGAGACGGSRGGAPPKGDPKRPPVKGEPVAAGLTAEQRKEVDRLKALLAETKGLTTDDLLQRRAIPFRAELGYDPTKATNIDLLQRSSLKLDAAELEALGRRGFVVSDKRRYPHFAYGYKTIYSQDLPVYISADAILQAVHQSYDDILKALELEALAPELDRLLVQMRTRLPLLSAAPPEARADADLFLAVALGLLRGEAVPPVAGADTSEIAGLVAKAQAAQGSAPATLFGAAREIDFSQWKPRGHYAGEPALERYFRAVMWLGRIDFPFLQTDPRAGKPVLVRRCVAAALALRAAMDDDARARWGRLDATIRAFVGEPDSMAPPEVDRLAADLAIAGPSLGGIADDALAAAIVAGAYGRQKILSQIVIQAPHDGPWPLDAVFLFFGQRYVFDSHVLSNVVYDRVPDRMMPNPLDVAYAALKNDQAAKLLEPELRRDLYAPALEAIRRLGDEHDAAFWEANLYNLWLSALRALSPSEIGDDKAGLPAVARTEAWGRRMLNTQLASWAQLRHDTILYAKPSYTSGVACEFPDAYVEPYPAFFAAVERFAAKGGAIAAALPLAAGSSLAGRVTSYFARLGEVAAILRDMAERQRRGEPHAPEHLAFINQAVDLNLGCGGPAGIRGWYADLFFLPGDAAEFDPTIADVHTQPTDKAGTFVGRVLHVGTGWARLAVITVDTCKGPRVYAGVVSSYHEVVTEKLERLSDQDWAKRFRPDAIPADVPWMKDLVVT